MINSQPPTQDEKSRLTREALVDVDTDKIIDHQYVQVRVENLNSNSKQNKGTQPKKS